MTTVSQPVGQWFQSQVESGRQTWLLLDGSAGDDVLQHLFSLEDSPHYCPLFTYCPPLQGLLSLSPILVNVAAHSPLMDWFLAEDRPSRLGILVSGRGDLETTAAALAETLFPEREGGGRTLCRWQDPQVLCDCMQLPAVFPVVVQGLSSVLMNANITGSIGAWVHCEIPEQGERKALRIPLSFLDGYHELREARLLDRHVATLRGDVVESEKTVTKRFHGCDVRILSTRSFGPVDDAERDAVRSECRELRKRYGFDLPQLLDIRLLFHRHPQLADVFDTHLSDTTLPTHKRIALCRKHVR